MRFQRSDEGQPTSASVPRAVLEVVGELRCRLADTLGDDLLDVRIFGSYARGEAHEDSDVDVFVLVRDASYRVWRRVIDEAAELWVGTGFHLSPTVMDEPHYRAWLRQERALAMDIEREGVRP